MHELKWIISNNYREDNTNFLFLRISKHHRDT